MKIEQIKIENLKPYQRNSRTHSADQIAKVANSIREFGFTNPILIQGDGTVVAGHGRLEAAKQLGLEQVPCIRLDHLTPAQARAYVIADNALAEQAGWDKEILQLELAELQTIGFDLDLIGLENLDKYLAHLPSNEGLTNPDDVPPAPKEPTTRPGDLWALGNHRLLCGDSTSKDALCLLLGGGYADMVFTDPPYNVDYQGGTKDALKIQNDKMSSSKFFAFLLDTFTAAAAVCKPGAPIYVCHSDSEGINFRKSLIDSGWLLKTCLIWVKNHFCIGRMDYHMRHEPILYGWRAGGPHKWYGGRKQDSIIDEMTGIKIAPGEDHSEISFSDGVRTAVFRVPSFELINATDDSISTIWKVDKPLKNPDHPTTKPVIIPQRAIQNSSANGDKVLDLFLGSGSTLIACEMTGRRCYGMELDPKYCDVIVKRWEQFTGQTAEVIR